MYIKISRKCEAIIILMFENHNTRKFISILEKKFNLNQELNPGPLAL